TLSDSLSLSLSKNISAASRFFSISHPLLNGSILRFLFIHSVYLFNEILASRYHKATNGGCNTLHFRFLDIFLTI
ncbi:hypothetical protein SOVF_149450, partial [Spinacia oleracea]